MATPDIQPRKQVQQPADWISELPDEILAHTVSFLTLKDAVRTSVLSKRWIDVWKFTESLDFDNRVINRKDLELSAIDWYMDMHNVERRKLVKYIGWVNQVLHSHKSMDLEAFRISYRHLDESHRDHLHQWIQYAFARKVKKFELDLSEKFTVDPFIFPSHLLSRFQSLKSLTLKRISVLGEELEYLLHNCPFLEHLKVTCAYDLKDFEVCGSSIALKHLEINYCHKLSSLRVCDTNIVSLRTTEGEKLVLKNVPMLVDVFVTQFPSKYSIEDAFSWISCCLLNLEAITLEASLLDIDSGWDATEAGIPQLIKLKKFCLIASLDEKDKSLLSYTSLVRASPNLEKFVLKLECWNRHKTVFQARESKKGVRLPLQHLKVVEFEGYYGSTTEVELVQYFAENAASLERIVVDPRIHSLIFFGEFEDDPNKEPERKLDQTARNLATQQMQNLLPSSVELVIY